ncbi:MAG: hypothetical protein J2P24_01360 [Streptosporangiales bacterium]|nr:hypothetical protein [Streptosporangiales bacterium]MBO0891195.1 hypothetical protein [Acidothermales bacterium]
MRKKTRQQIDTALTEGGTLSARKARKAAKGWHLDAEKRQVVTRDRKGGVKVVRDFGKGGK